MKVFVIVTILLLVAVAATRAKTFTKCSLLKELEKQNFPRSFLSNWVCLAMASSSMDTSKVTTLPDGTKNYGLFQINSKNWCRDEFKGGNCKSKCADFLKDDIAEISKCAKMVFTQMGFKDWPAWNNKCKGKSLPNINDCY